MVAILMTQGLIELASLAMLPLMGFNLPWIFCRSVPFVFFAWGDENFEANCFHRL
jgi:hypothetical protein